MLNGCRRALWEVCFPELLFALAAKMGELHLEFSTCEAKLTTKLRASRIR